MQFKKFPRRILPITFLLAVGCFISLTSTRSWAAKDACSLVTAEDAQSAIGESVGPGRSQPRPLNGAEATNCRFRSLSHAAGGKSVSLTVAYSDSDIRDAMKQMLDSLKSAGMQNVHDVPGVGDSAVWGMTTVMGKPSVELTVRKGNNIMLIIIIDGLDEATALERARMLAAKVLPKA